MPRSRGEEGSFVSQDFSAGATRFHPPVLSLWFVGNKDLRAGGEVMQHAQECPLCRDIVERISRLPDDERASRLLEIILRTINVDKLVRILLNSENPL